MEWVYHCSFLIYFLLHDFSYLFFSLKRSVALVGYILIHIYDTTDLYRCHCFVVYDKMGYIGAVTKTAEDSLLEHINEACNTDSYQENNGGVSLGVT